MRRLRSVSIILLALASLAACNGRIASPDTEGARANAQARPALQTAQSEYVLGKRALADNRYATAAAHFRAALQSNNDHLDARNGLGVALSGLGEHERAAAVFEQVLQIRPNDAFVLSNLGYLHLMQGRPDEAIDLFERSLAIDADNARTHANLAGARFLKRQMEVAQSTTAITQPAGAPAPRAVPAEVGLVSVAPNVYELRRRPERNAAEAGGTPTRSDGAVVAISPGVFHLVSTDAGANDPARNAARARWAGTPDPARAREAFMDASRSASAIGGASGALARSGLSGTRPDGAGRVEVSNGNGVTGMARRVAAYLHDQGLGLARLTNVPGFSQRETQVQYRPGFEQEAQRLQMTLPVATDLVQTERLRAGVDVRLVLGRDIANETVTAWSGGKSPASDPRIAVAAARP